MRTTHAGLAASHGLSKGRTREGGREAAPPPKGYLVVVNDASSGEALVDPGFEADLFAFLRNRAPHVRVEIATKVSTSAAVKTTKVAEERVIRLVGIATDPTRGPDVRGAPAAYESSLARGEARLLRWIDDGTLVAVSALTDAWGITRQSIDDARKAGKLFSVYVKGQHWYPKEVLNFRREDLARVSQALGSVGAVAKLLFLMKPHQALRNLTPAQAVDSGMLEDVVRIAGSVARD